MRYRQLQTPNLDPVIHVWEKDRQVELRNWAGWCLAYVEVAFGTKRLYESAWEAWRATKKSHPGRSFPKNVFFPTWFEHWGSYGSPPRYGNWGHVAIARVNDDGSMVIWSSPASAKAAPDTYHSIELIERIYSSTYVGWSEDIAETLLISEELEMNVWPDKIDPMIAKLRKPIPMYNIQTGERLHDSGLEIFITHKTPILHGSTFYIPKDRADQKQVWGFREEDLYKNGTVAEVSKPAPGPSPEPVLTDQQRRDLQTGQQFRELVKQL